MDPTPHVPPYTTIGHYQLLEAIGRGGMGLVFRARDTRLERQVAIKCLRTELFEPHYIERFKREALLLAKLNHPNIVQIYDFVEAPDQLALVMELVDGQNLKTYLREQLPSMAQRLRWLTQITEGLAVAHEAGIIHRDLKAENILINKRGEAKLTDLGIAKSQDFNATLTDHVAGSYCSMSPEQAMGEPLTFKSDLFSLGILTYELLCGAHPFGDPSNKLQLLQRIISHPPTPPQQHFPELPSAIVDLLGQLLSKDPDNRPDNTSWVAAQFKLFSQLPLPDDHRSDDTLALIAPYPQPGYTQDRHPTFETRGIVDKTRTPSRWQRLKQYLAENRIAVGSATITLLILAGTLVWQLQPKPPKYVAVVPPIFTAEDMQAPQQTLVQGAVYDALQQGIIQLKGYYLISLDGLDNIHGNYEALRRATAADEIITTKIHCTLESCSISLVRLTPNDEQDNARLGVAATRTFDVLTDHYLSIAATTQYTLAGLYASAFAPSTPSISEADYVTILNAHKKYKTHGASPELLSLLNSLGNTTKNNATAQNLFRDVALDLYYETADNHYLSQLEYYLDNATHKDSIVHLYNSFQLKVSQRQFAEANHFKQKLTAKLPSQSLAHELNAYINMAENNYAEAVASYKSALLAKPTFENLYYLANAYWNLGDTERATQYLNRSISLAPNYYWAHSLMGIIALYNGEIDAAISAFETIKTLRPDDSANLNNLGLCHLLKRQPEEAYTLFARASELAPLNATYLLNRADAEQLAQHESAAATYRQVIELVGEQANDSLSLRSKAQAYAHVKEFDGALSVLRRLEQLDPQNTEVLYTAAIIHTLAENPTAALFNIEQTLKNGMHPRWFNFSWFDHLCGDTRFVGLMQKYGDAHRCAPASP